MLIEVVGLLYVCITVEVNLVMVETLEEQNVRVYCKLAAGSSCTLLATEVSILDREDGDT